MPVCAHPQFAALQLDDDATDVWLVAETLHPPAARSSRNRKLDFVLRKGDTVVAIEVKSARRRSSLRGTDAFAKHYTVKRKLLVGGDGIPLQDFLLTPPMHWLD